jgi:hypothetical protein
LAGAAAGCVVTTIAAATGVIAGLAALAPVVVVVASVAAVSSWFFLSPDDCFPESPVVAAVVAGPGTAACGMPLGFGAFDGEAEFESAGLWALVVVPFCAEGLLPFEGGGAVAVLGFVAGWLFWPCEVCAGAGLLPLVAAALDFELLFDWKVLLCRREPLAGAGGGFDCAPVCCWEAAASSNAVNGWASACCAVGRAGDRCCDADCTNDDAELTSDAILGTARSLKANGRRSACNRRASLRSPDNRRKFNMLGERAALGAVLIRRAMGKFCRPSRKEAYLLRSGG